MQELFFVFHFFHYFPSHFCHNQFPFALKALVVANKSVMKESSERNGQPGLEKERTLGWHIKSWFLTVSLQDLCQPMSFSFQPGWPHFAEQVIFLCDISLLVSQRNNRRKGKLFGKVGKDDVGKLGENQHLPSDFLFLCRLALVSP